MKSDEKEPQQNGVAKNDESIPESGENDGN